MFFDGIQKNCGKKLKLDSSPDCNGNLFLRSKKRLKWKAGGIYKRRYYLLLIKNPAPTNVETGLQNYETLYLKSVATPERIHIIGHSPVSETVISVFLRHIKIIFRFIDDSCALIGR